MKEEKLSVNNLVWISCLLQRDIYVQFENVRSIGKFISPSSNYSNTSKVIEQGNDNYFLTLCENRSREVRGTVCQRKFVKREGFLVGREYRVGNSTWYSSPT